MAYLLKTSDGLHKNLGTSNGNLVNAANDTFWVTGWSTVTQNAVSVGGFYSLSKDSGASYNSVEVEEKGGAGMGGIRFSYTG